MHTHTHTHKHRLKTNNAQNFNKPTQRGLDVLSAISLINLFLPTCSFSFTITQIKSKLILNPINSLSSYHGHFVPFRLLLCEFSRNSSVQNSSFSLSVRWCAVLRHQELPGRSALWSPCSPLERGCLSGVGPDPLEEPACLPGAALFHCLVGSVAGGAVCHW